MLYFRDSFLNSISVGLLSNIHNTISIDLYNLTVQLSSRIFGIGTPIHYRYESIISKTLIINSSSGGNYIVPTSAITHELSNNDQICTVTFYGDVKNAAGTTIISNLKLSVEFDANEAQ